MSEMCLFSAWLAVDLMDHVGALLLNKIIKNGQYKLCK